MNLSDLLTALYDDLDYDPTPGTVITTRLTRYLNDGYREILRQPAFTDLLTADIEFDSIANQAIYGIPQVFDALEGVVQQSNQRTLNLRTRAWLRKIDPGVRASGLPTDVIIKGYQPTMRQPDNTGVWAVSSAAGDITPKVRIRGVRTAGYLAPKAEATLTGTARVAIGSLTDYVNLTAVTLDGAATGTVSLYDAVTNGNLLGQIAPGRTDMQFVMVQLWPTPADALTYLATGPIVVPDLVDLTDIPRLPLQYHDLIETYARMRTAKKKGDMSRFALEEKDWNDGIEKLNQKEGFPPGWRPIAGVVQEGARWSNLGGWYPADGTGL